MISKVLCLQVFNELTCYINKADLLLKVRFSLESCSFKRIQVFLFFEYVFDFNLLFYRRIFAFFYFVFLLNSFPTNLRYRDFWGFRVGGLKLIIKEVAFWPFLWHCYLFYFKALSDIRRKEFFHLNCLICNVYNLFLFPGFLEYCDDFSDFRFCSLKLIFLLNCSGIYLHLFLSSYNFVLLK